MISADSNNFSSNLELLICNSITEFYNSFIYSDPNEFVYLDILITSNAICL